MLEKKGLVKLVEECGELIQIAAKKMTRMDSNAHWDNAGSLKERLENEIADVIAACDLVINNFDLDSERINLRMDKKRELFEKWQTQKDETIKCAYCANEAETLGMCADCYCVRQRFAKEASKSTKN